MKDEQGAQGPLSESAMRKLVSNSASGLQVKQGDGDWYSADVVREKIAALKANGIYIRYKGVAEGPFTLTRAHQLLATTSSDGVRVRTGAKGKWVGAKAWLETVQRLESKQKQSEIRSITSALKDAASRSEHTSAGSVNPRPKPTVKPGGSLPEEIPVAIPVANAPLTAAPVAPVANPIPLAIPVDPNVTSVAEVVPVEAAEVPMAIPVATPVAAPATLGAGLFGGLPSPEYRPTAQVPPRRTSGSAMKSQQPVAIKIASVVLTIILVMGAIGLKVLKYGGKAALKHQQRQQQVDRQSSR
ncbi:MAG: hypothetical protein AB8B91_01105 [Rubripirellula sp.]